MNYILNETIENRLKSLETSYYINLSDLIESKLFDKNSIYTRDKLREIAIEMEKIKDYCEVQDIELDFSFKFDEQAGVLSFLETERRCIDKRIEDYNLQLNILENTSLWNIPDRLKISSLKSAKSKEISKYIDIDNYIENFDENYTKDLCMLRPYFIELSDDFNFSLDYENDEDDFITFKLQIKVNKYTNKIAVEVVDIG